MPALTQARVPVEITLVAECPYSDIFRDVDVDVVFSGPDGREWRVPAFWAGDTTFRARFAPPAPGRYVWRSTCTNADDPGLHGQSEEIEVEQNRGTDGLYAHGRLQAAESGRTLEHTDGTPFFWLGDTWWMGLTKRLDWPDGFQSLAHDRVQKGFSVIQIVCGPLPDFCATKATWDPQQANEAGWPWEEGFARINPAFYDLADQRISALVDAGLVPCIVGMWGYYLPFMGVDNVRRHWRNLVARYAAYPVVWCIAGEATMPAYAWHADREKAEAAAAEQKAGWTEVARMVGDIDPYANPITVHPGCPNNSREMLEDDLVIDFEMLQTGHSGYYSLEPTVRTTAAAVAKRPRMPVLNSEVCYDGIMGGSKDEIQRFCFWSSMTAGTCGHTYGAQGIWAMSSRDEPFKGTTNNWGDGFWQDVMHLPGSTHVGIGRKFFDRYPWWRLEPEDQPALPEGRLASYVTGISGQLHIAYVPVSCVAENLRGLQKDWGTGLAPITVGPGEAYHAYFFNPRSGAETDLGNVTAGADGRWAPAGKPSMEDWVLVLEKCGVRKGVTSGQN